MFVLIRLSRVDSSPAKQVPCIVRGTLMLKIVKIREKKIKEIVMTEKSYMFDGWYMVFIHHIAHKAHDLPATRS
jgi:hypothetical protein